MGRADPMVLRENSNQGLLRWFEQPANEAFQASGPGYAQPECKERLQNQSDRWAVPESYRVVTPRPTSRLTARERNFMGRKGLVGPPGLEPGTNRL
jgi:hypothetical protein